MEVETDHHDTLIHATTWEDINDPILDGYEVVNGKQTEPNNKPIGRDQYTYK